MAAKRRLELSERERLIFKYLGEGKRYRDIATLVGLRGENNITAAVTRGRQIIGAETTCHAIKLLCERGFFNDKKQPGVP